MGRINVTSSIFVEPLGSNTNWSGGGGGGAQDTLLDYKELLHEQ